MNNKILEILESANLYIHSNQEKFINIGINYGLLGLSLYNFYLYEFYSEKKYKEQATSLLETSLQKLNNGYVSDSIYREIVELGWFLMICKKNRWIEHDISDQLETIDTFIFDLIQDSIQENNFDPVTGILSFGYYLLEREKSNKSINTKLNEILVFLEDISFENSNGLYWKSKLKGDDSVYLGITHGSANVILFLKYLSQKPSFLNNEIINKLINKSTNFINHSRLDNSYLVFPTVVGKIEKDVYPKSYCYGDYGTLYGMMSGYQFFKLEDKINEGIALFNEIEARGYDNPFLNAGHSLLYGSSGLAMLFRIFHLNFKSNDILSAYQKMINKTVNAYKPTEESLGYLGFWNQELDYINISFNEGLIGISIELMHYVKPGMNFHFENFFYLKIEN